MLVMSSTESVTYFVQRAKILSDKLASLDSPILKKDLVDSILDGLRGSLWDVYRAFGSRTIKFDDMFGILLTEETHLKRDKLIVEELNAPSAHYTVKLSEGSGRGRGRGLKNQEYRVQSTGLRSNKILLGVQSVILSPIGHFNK